MFQIGTEMNLDPSRWLVSFAGLTYDWAITREWKKIIFAMLPMALLVALATVAWMGGQLDRSKLVARYLELGDQEISQWEQSWAPGADGATQPDKADGAASSDTSVVTAEGDAEGTAGSRGTKLPELKLSRFAEVIFRRVQLLEPSTRSQFVVGATLAQRGASDRAIKMLSRVAPDDRAGYAPAHAYLAMLYADLARTSRRPELAPVVLHHASAAAVWERVPVEVLRLASSLSFDIGDSTNGLRMLGKLAEKNPEFNFQLAEVARRLGNNRVKDQALISARSYAEQRLSENPKDEQARVMLAEAYLKEDSSDRFAEAEKLLMVPFYEQSPVLSRALSDLYCERFRDVLNSSIASGKRASDISLLDMAMRIDPTNPRVPEMVAALARMGGQRPSQEMVTQLQEFIAEGKATAFTHLWLSEIYLLREDYEKAVPHMQQVLFRMPNMPANLNNLAYVYAERYPDQLEEALKLVQQSIALSQKEPNANFFDTLGMVLMKMQRYQEAIAALETAIQLQPMRIDFQERIREAHMALGNDEMASIHAKRIENLKAERARAISEAELRAQDVTNRPAAPSAGADSSGPASKPGFQEQQVP
jgi:tetratricopeptide (TPR) repeat protein